MIPTRLVAQGKELNIYKYLLTANCLGGLPDACLMPVHVIGVLF